MNVEYEREITKEYVAQLLEAYNHFFFHYSITPLLAVNVSEVDFENRPEHLEDLLAQIKSPPSGTRYYRPAYMEAGKTRQT